MVVFDIRRLTKRIVIQQNSSGFIQKMCVFSHNPCKFHAMISKLVHIQRDYIYFYSHGAAELGKHFVKNFYKTGKSKPLPDHEWIKYSNLLWLCFLFWGVVGFFNSISPSFLVFFLQRWGACFWSLSVGLRWKEPVCHGSSRSCVLLSESPYAAPFVLHKMVCLKVLLMFLY